MQKEKSMIIIDGFALIFRAYYAFANNPLSTKLGTPVSAIFGFTRMLMKIIKTYKPNYLIIALDHKDKTFRHKIYPNYKANRIEAPEDLKIQIPLVLKLIEEFKIKNISISGYEADDIIGSLCKKYKKNKDLNISIITGDKDILQLVDTNIKVISPYKGISQLIEYDIEKVKEKWGVIPSKIPFLLALMGDSSDNIEGVPNIGPKTAAKLIKEYGNIENIYKNINFIKRQKLRENLKECKDLLDLNYKLAIIDTEINLDIKLKELENSNLNQPKAVSILKEYEFQSIIADSMFSKNSNNKTEQINSKENQDQTSKIKCYETNAKEKIYKLIKTQKEWLKLKNSIIKDEIVSIDLESTEINIINAEIIGISLSYKENEAYFIPFFKGLENKNLWKDELENCDLNQDFLYKEIKSLCEDKKIKKIGQNIKYDYSLLKLKNIEINNIHFDTMLASYILNPSSKSHGMDYMAENILNYKTIKYKEIVTDKTHNLLNVPLSQLVTYACEDADITLKLYYYFKKLLDKSESKNLYNKIELPLVKILAEMEIEGVNIDENYLKNMSIKLEEMLNEYQKKIWKLTGTEFNINSNKQLQEILFTKLKLKPSKKIKTGYSTDVSVLEKLSHEHEFAKILLEHRKIYKLKSAYIDSIPKLINQKTKKIHTSFNQALTQTGRLSSNNPNLQNIPIKEEMGKKIRKAFTAEKNHLILSADYSQIELRILAHITQDPKLINAYQKDQDIHLQTASILFSKTEDKVNQEERRIGKTINFSVIYGIGSLALSKSLNIDKNKAKEFIEKYFNEYKKVQEYIKMQKATAYQKGYVETLLKRKRYIKELKSPNNKEKSSGERIAVNTPIQGTSADIIKIAMININTKIKNEKIKAKMLIQIHDELLFEVEKSEIIKMKTIVKIEMENAYKLSIPLKTSISYGKSWAEAH